MKKELDTVVEKWNLLTHPFYQSWSAGTLPVEALQVYAREYGNFINTLPRGWETLNDAETAAEEREHADMWTDFTAAVGGFSAEATLDQTVDLVRVAKESFTTRAATLGAMYAFEVQQPATAKSKLEGLKAHYKFGAAVDPYFAAHSVNWHESEKILALIQALSADEKAEALVACERMAHSLWDALSGIHDATCKMN